MDKRPEKMTEQDALLALQMKEKDRARLYDILTILFFVLVIYVFAVLMFILPDKEFSEQENRMLALRPAYSTKSRSFAERLIDGSFTSEIASYYSDQFPMRDVFTGIKGTAEILFGKRQNNGIISASAGYIIKREDYPDYENIQRNLDYIKSFAEKTGTEDVEVYFALAGRPVDLLTNYLPAGFPKYLSVQLWDFLSSSAKDNGDFIFIDLLDALKTEAAKEDSEQLYYRTDHHWTSLGAYYAYESIMKHLGEPPKPLEEFTIETVSDGFYGTTWSSAGMKWIKPDSIEYFRYEGDDTDYMTLIEDDGSSYLGFYNRDYLDKKDKYGSFIGGNKSANNGRVDVVKLSEENSDNREKLLIIKDSYAHSIVPFLAYHYDLVIIDLRYYFDSITALMKEERISRLLILNYAGSLSEAVTFNRLY